MTMKECYAPIVDGRMEMPQEILEVLPQGIPLYICTDSERGAVTILAKDPAKFENQWYFDEKKEEFSDPDWWEYKNDGPIPPALLGKQKPDEEDE